jgi:hypothetical protein
MSRYRRWETPAIRKAKAVRRELVRPLRLLLEDTPFSLRLSDHNLNRAYIVGVGTMGLSVDLTEPIDAAAIFDWMEDDLQRSEDWLDHNRRRVANARSRCEAVQS